MSSDSVIEIEANPQPEIMACSDLPSSFPSTTLSRWLTLSSNPSMASDSGELVPDPQPEINTHFLTRFIFLLACFVPQPSPDGGEEGTGPQQPNEAGTMWIRRFRHNHSIRSFFRNTFGWVASPGWLTSSFSPFMAPDSVSTYPDIEEGPDPQQPNEAGTMSIRRFRHNHSICRSFFHNTFGWVASPGWLTSSFSPFMAPDSVSTYPDIEEGPDPQQPNEAGTMWIRRFRHNHGIRSFFRNTFGWVASPGWLTSSSSNLLENRDGEANDPQPPDEAASRRIMMSVLLWIGIKDEQELGKLLLRVGIPLGVSLGLSANVLVQTTAMSIVAMSIAVSISLTFNGLSLRNNYPTSSTYMLLSGAALMLFSFFALLGFFMPVYLKWIPVLCCLASLFPFAKSVWASF